MFRVYSVISDEISYLTKKSSLGDNNRMKFFLSTDKAN